MTRKKSHPFTEGELEFMQVLWFREEATPDELMEELAGIGRTVTGGTIRNVLATLMKKGYVIRKKRGKTHVYKAKVGEDQAARTMVYDLLDRAFGGSESLMVTALLKNREVRKEEMEEIKRLIDKKSKAEQK